MSVQVANQLETARWSYQLQIAISSARTAGVKLLPHFGARLISAYKSQHDVQLRADILAQESIVRRLSREFPGYGMVAEESVERRWSDKPMTWAVDPLDGTNNFGYGIAHCAIAITLFERESVVVAVIFDPLLKREFFATEDGLPPAIPRVDVQLQNATVSLVTGYSDEGRAWGLRANDHFASRCKRMLSMWAPSLDLALISTGALDGMVCRNADFLDVCGGMFILAAAGGSILDLDGRPLTASRSMWQAPVDFVAGRTPTLARALLREVQSI